MAQNEMRAMRGLPQSVRLSEWLGLSLRCVGMCICDFTSKHCAPELLLPLRWEGFPRLELDLGEDVVAFGAHCFVVLAARDNMNLLVLD